MTSDSSANPWAEFRRRWRPLVSSLALWVSSLLMLFSKELEQAWVATTSVLLSVALLCLWRISQLRCPRCEQLFYWPPRLKYRVRKCSHCGLWEYDPYNIDGFSERQSLTSGGA